jgi:hypothetical protein
VGVLPEFRNGVDNSFKWAEFGLLRKMVFDRERLVSTSLESLKESASLVQKRSPTKSTDPEVRATIEDIQKINNGKHSSAILKISILKGHKEY